MVRETAESVVSFSMPDYKNTKHLSTFAKVLCLDVCCQFQDETWKPKVDYHPKCKLQEMQK